MPLPTRGYRLGHISRLRTQGHNENRAALIPERLAQHGCQSALSVGYVRPGNLEGANHLLVRDGRRQRATAGLGHF